MEEQKPESPAENPAPKQNQPLTFIPVEQAPEGSAWRRLPPGARYRPIGSGQHITNPKRTFRASTGLKGRQWVKLRKWLMKVHVAKLGMSHQQYKRLVRQGLRPEKIAQLNQQQASPESGVNSFDLQ